MIELEVKDYVPTPHECVNNTGGTRCDICFWPLDDETIINAYLVIENVNGISAENKAAICRWLRNNLIQFECVNDVYYTQNKFEAKASVKNGEFQ